MDFKQNDIVWIAQWYPHEGDAYAGDFIKRHAQAASAFVPVTVYACFGYDGVEKTVVEKAGNLTEVVSYFNHPNTGFASINKLVYWNRWYRILKNHLIKHERERGKPMLLHCHIILNAGWLGLWVKKKWDIPFIVTEHWAGYMAGFVNGFDAYNTWSKIKCKQIIMQAAVITGVSQALICQLKKIQPKGNFIRLPNVVNENFFYYKHDNKKARRPVFIHISTLTWQKNVTGILEAVYLTKQKLPDVLLKIAGPIRHGFQDLIFNLELQQNIEWLGEMPQEQLVDEIRSADALILFSQYESFGCVVIEANAAGVPVIVSNIAPLQELVEHGINGLVVEEGNVESLAATMLIIEGKKMSFSNSEISKKTLEQYGFAVIGRQIADMYASLLIM